MSQYSKLNAVIEFILDDEAEEKLKALFELFDLDGNGQIRRDELRSVLAICAQEISLDVDSYLDQIVDAIFNEAMKDNNNMNVQLIGSQSETMSQGIDLEGLRSVLKCRPNLVNELSLLSKSKDSNNENSNNSNSQTRYKRNRDYCSNPSARTTDRMIERWDMMLDSVTDKAPIFNKLRWDYISNNHVAVVFTVSLFTITSFLYVSRIFTYWDYGMFVIIARASGQSLNFLCAIVVLLICRRSISYLRSHGVGKYLPLDDHVYFHKLTGWYILVHSLLHTLGHLMNFYAKSLHSSSTHSWLEYVFSTNLKIGWIGGSACLTGWLLLAIIFIMALAQPFSRRYGKFELFYYTHLLFIPFWVLLIIHAPNFWIWFLAPCAVYLLETAVRTKSLMNYYFYQEDESTIVRGVPLPSNVLYLVIKRPHEFDYKPGDWVYVRIPEIAKYEWHPFTISSAPEQEEVITLHIRAIGEWTKTLRNYFVKNNVAQRDRLTKFIKSGQFSMSIDNKFYTSVDLNPTDSTFTLGQKARNKLSTHSCSTAAILPAIQEDQSMESVNLSGCTNSKITLEMGELEANSKHLDKSAKHNAKIANLKILIDGPYSSPASQIFRSEHSVLVATGIGVTPFASILQSLVHHNARRCQKCPSCACEFLDSSRPIVNKLRKVDFVWINRDQKSFEWFIKLLAELELSQSQLHPHDRFLDIHIYLTAIEKSKVKSIGMQLALYLVHEQNKKDLITGLRTRTKAGRPEWDKFFQEIYDQKKGRVSVFFCGRPQLGRELHKHCDKFGFKFRKEIF